MPDIDRVKRLRWIAGGAGGLGVGGVGVGGVGGVVFLVVHGGDAMATSTLTCLLIAWVCAWGIVAVLALVLAFALESKAADARRSEQEKAAQLAAFDAEQFWSLMNKAAGEPESAEAYVRLADAASRFKAVGPDGSRLTDGRHENLYGKGGPSVAPKDDAEDGV